MISVAAVLTDAGARVLGGSPHQIEYAHDGRLVTAEIARFDVLPTRISQTPRRADRLLVVCSTASPHARRAALSRPATDVVIEHPREVVLSGRTYVGGQEPARVRRAGFGQAAIERVLLLSSRMRQADIAAAAGVSQQAVSKVSADWPAVMTVEDRRARLERWLSRYRPTVEETWWYGLDPVGDQVRAVVAYAGGELEVDVAVGGEVAADAIRPWRVPTRGLVHSAEFIDLTPIGLVAAGPEDATLTLQVGDDPTVGTTARWWSTRGGLNSVVVDPVMALWDLTRGRDIGDGAAEEMRDWIVGGSVLGEHSVDVDS